MNHWRLMLLALFSTIAAIAALTLGPGCGPITHTPVPPTPVAAGGSMSAGGSAANAGAAGQAGDASTGGAPTIAWPECNPPTHKAQPVVKHKLGRKHKTITKRATTRYLVLDLPDTAWVPLLPALNQRELGACTGFATLQCRLSAPWEWAGAMDIESLNMLARGIYSGATKRDPWPGVWPPTDTGSGGQWALDESVAQGVFAGYAEITSFADLQMSLQNGPCITGTDWYDGFFAPDRCGSVKKTGANAGGHEWVIAGIRHETKQLLGRTSWGDFGVSWHDRSGFFWVTFGTYQELLNAGGDIHCPFALDAP